jgi:multidrug efflux system outer membrane protein
LRHLAGLGLTLLVASIGHSETMPVPAIPLPARFANAPDIQAQPANAARWLPFADAALPELIQRLQAGNPRLDQARARLAIAQASARTGRASQRPQLALDAGASTAQGPLINPAGGQGSLFTARAGASWDIDPFGRLAGTRAAERLDAAAAAALLADTQLLVEGQMVRLWLALPLLVANADQAAAVAALAGEAAGISERQQAQGLRTRAAVDLARQHHAAALAQQDQARLHVEGAAREIGTLIGETAAIALPAAATSGPPLPEIAAGLPADLLLRRPDLAAARNHVLAADQRLRVERRSWLPMLSLTGSGGAASASLGALLAGGAASLVAGAVFAIPVLDGGRHKARVAGRRGERDLAIAQYRDQLLLALREVNDRLGRYQACRDAVARARAATAAADVAHAVAQDRFARGTIARTDVITADIQARQLHIDLATGESACAATAVDVIMALGGHA